MEAGEEAHTNNVGDGAAVTKPAGGSPVAVVDAIRVQVGFRKRQRQEVVVADVHQRVAQNETRRCRCRANCKKETCHHEDDDEDHYTSTRLLLHLHQKPAHPFISQLINPATPFIHVTESRAEPS